MENYLVAMLVFAGVYALLALGLNVVWGMAGMINLGLVGFLGLGAYVAALLAPGPGWPTPGAAPASPRAWPGARAGRWRPDCRPRPSSRRARARWWRW